MTKRVIDGKKLLEEALGNNGKISLSSLLAKAVPVQKLRELAKAHGLSPKGGYRIDKAPGYVLAPLMADAGRPKVVEAACSLLADHLSSDNGTGTKKRTETKKSAGKDKGEAEKPSNGETTQLLKLREQELAEIKDELTKARDVSNRQRQRLEEMDRGLQQDKELVARMRAEIQELRRELSEMRSGPVEMKDQTVEIHELERELEELSEVETDQRRLIAERQATIRDLEERIAELEPLIPKDRRKRKRPPPAAPPPPRERFRRPYFTQAFYKSLENKDRRAIESAYQAILLFCTEGPGYPGLQVKQLEAPIWSFRAALKLRVYFTNRDDGDIDVLALADRQEQSTALRRLREKQ